MNADILTDESLNQLDFLNKSTVAHKADGIRELSKYEEDIGAFNMYISRCFIEIENRHLADCGVSKEFERRLVEMLDTFLETGIKARWEYRINDDLDRFFSDTYRLVLAFLIAFTDFLTRRRRSNSREPWPSDLLLRLQKMGLERWVLLYEKDLFRNFRDVASAENSSNHFFINSHIERLFLLFGVVLEEGQRDGPPIKVGVPINSDYDNLEQLELLRNKR